jgi:curved DNA-binding protein CbpA
MSTPDYYELLGVDDDAPVDEIRAAYRDRKAALTGDEKNKDTDAAKAEVARLNKAWNVLSDPFQRGRYDIDRANPSDADDEEDDDDITPVRRSTKTAPADSGARKTAAERRAERANAAPTVTLPPGMHFPSTKRRLIAMGIDIAVLAVLFLASQFVLVHLEKANHRAAYDEVTALNKSTGDKSIAQAHDATKKAKKAASANVKCAPEPTSANDKAYCDAKAKEDALKQDLKDAQKELAPTASLVQGVFFLLALLFLLVPSFFGGQTLGKRLQRVRVVRVDGTPLRWLDVFRRYTALVFAAYILTFATGGSPIGALIVVFVATLWTRNPNQQALQDKFAKTLVLTDVEE